MAGLPRGVAGRRLLLSNYHLPSDTPENLDFGTVAQALALTETLACRLADLA